MGQIVTSIGITGFEITRLEALLASPFAKKAPPEIVKKEREKLETCRDTAKKIRIQLDELIG